MGDNEKTAFPSELSWVKSGKSWLVLTYTDHYDNEDFEEIFIIIGNKLIGIKAKTDGKLIDYMTMGVEVRGK